MPINPSNHDVALNLCDVLPAAQTTPQVIGSVADQALAESGTSALTRL